MVDTTLEMAAMDPSMGAVQQDRTRGRSRLEVDAISVRFGGLQALRDLSLRVQPGEIVSLLGPNGAGKTTLFNVITGRVAPTEGTVRFDDVSVDQSSPVDRARLGIGRTFQRMELFDDLTAVENVVVAKELTDPPRLVRGCFQGRSLPPGLESDAMETLVYLGLGPYARVTARNLSTGQRRLLELARALIADPRLLLLDEPSSGLDRSESDRFTEIIQDHLAARPDTAVLLVEHDMRVALGLADYVYVLDFGVLIASGDPDAIRQDDVVRAAYLGKDA